ncbi:hypothetical protein J2046_002603 [Rhizobium petrolearium]|nr:hypothetical protein [Neorhizobium petrolearium]
MKQMENDLDTRLDWIAVDHHNTGHPTLMLSCGACWTMVASSTLPATISRMGSATGRGTGDAGTGPAERVGDRGKAAP